MDKKILDKALFVPFIRHDESFDYKKVQLYSGEDEVYLVYVNRGKRAFKDFTTQRGMTFTLTDELPILWSITEEYAKIICEYLNKEFKRPAPKEDSNA